MFTVKDTTTGKAIGSQLDYLTARRVRRDHPGPAVLVDEDGDEVSIGGRPSTGERKQHGLPALLDEWDLFEQAASAEGLPTATWLRHTALAAADELRRIAGFGPDDVVPEERFPPEGKGAPRVRGERREVRMVRAHDDEWRRICEAAGLFGQKPVRWFRDVAMVEARRVLEDSREGSSSRASSATR